MLSFALGARPLCSIHCAALVSVQVCCHSISDFHPNEAKQIELQAKVLDYFLGSNKSNINVIAGAKWYATVWPRAPWPLFGSSALSSSAYPSACLKGKPICSYMSHNHVDSSFNSAFKPCCFSNSLHRHNSIAALLVV